LKDLTNTTRVIISQKTDIFATDDLSVLIEELKHELSGLQDEFDASKQLSDEHKISLIAVQESADTAKEISNQCKMVSDSNSQMINELLIYVRSFDQWQSNIIADLDEFKDHLADSKPIEGSVPIDLELIDAFRIDLDNTGRIAQEAGLSCERLSTLLGDMMSELQMYRRQLRCLKYEVKMLKGVDVELSESEIEKLRLDLENLSNRFVDRDLLETLKHEFVEIIHHEHDVLENSIDDRFQQLRSGLLPELQNKVESLDNYYDTIRKELPVIIYSLNEQKIQTKKLHEKLDDLEKRYGDNEDHNNDDRSLQLTMMSLAEDIASIVGQQADDKIRWLETINTLKEVSEQATSATRQALLTKEGLDKLGNEVESLK
jgi:hypothetical protein